MSFTTGHENWIEQLSKQDNDFICSCLDIISLRVLRSEERRLYFIRRQRYIETVMRDTSNAGMQSCTKSCYSIEYSIRVQ